MTIDTNSDYTTNSTDLFKLLPEVYGSNTNRAVFSNLFNRFLSKDQTQQVAGYIGIGNPNAAVSRQIKEPTVHRQAFQLQPLMYSKIGTIEYIDSWYDILNELDRQGIDISQLPIWANTTEFNWAPPVDINKIVNYQDYYWYDSVNPSSQPQYITVRGNCSTATSYVNFYQGLINLFGDTFNIVAVSPSTSSIYVFGNFTTLFQSEFVIFIQNSTNTDINNSFQTVSSSSYNTTTNQTTVVLSSPFGNSTANGQISLQQQLDIYQGIQTCQCSGGSGWDLLQWDDNQSNNPPPLWNSNFSINVRFSTLSAWNIANPTPSLGALFWNGTNDTLYSLNDTSNPTNINSFQLVASNFSLIFNQSLGTAAWDLSVNCGDSTTISGLDQWISQNMWLHKADVPNFTIAKQAAAPIIEFEPQLELNEWTSTTYTWQYRAETSIPFSDTIATPNKFELQPLNVYTVAGNTLILDEKFGDFTNIFVPGYQFLIGESTSIWTVVNSTYQRTSLPSGAFRTHIIVTNTLPTLVTYLYPVTTSQGDVWRGYNVHWLFIGVNNTTAINHQPENSMMTISEDAVSIVDSSGDFSYTIVPYAEQYSILATQVTALPLDNVVIPSGSNRTMQQRALVGFDDIRVYLNGVRQYGNYNELGTIYVTGIQFFNGLNIGDQVLIQVGEAAMSDLGNYSVPLRTIADDTEFTSVGTVLTSLVQMRKVEQIKVGINQYPLFDSYFTNSLSANLASEIFSYQQATDSQSGTIIPVLQQRVVLDISGNYMFQNWLVQTNNGRMYAYRNYSKVLDLYWYNPNTEIVYIWNGLTWATKYETIGGYYISPLVLPTLPLLSSFNYINGIIVFNTTNNTLFQLIDNNWITLSVHISSYDETLETIWRHGLNNEQYVPKQVDWVDRSYPEYLEDEASYIQTTIPELIAANSSLTTAQATTQAQTQWNTTQQKGINPAWYTDPTIPTVVTNGNIWVGNWEIPDPLYFNAEHENWQYISTQDLEAHFSSIVDSQPDVPGFTGNSSAKWRLLSPTQINWGLGGTIKEYDNSFDTFLSTAYINTVIPLDLFSFAQNEYESIIITLGEYYQRNVVSDLTSLNSETFVAPDTFVANQVIQQYEENEAAALVYGDSTTYDPIAKTGIQNWIATLPYFGIVSKVVPYKLIDNTLGINSIRHHDGHYNNYSLPSTVVSFLQQQIINTPDTRTTNSQGIVLENFGRLSSNPPPSTQTLFFSEFSSNIRPGVYWLNDNILYELVVGGTGPTSPPNSFPDGTLWIDTTTNSLRIKITIGSTIQWNVASGFIIGDGNLFNGFTVQTSTISAWQVVDLNEYFINIVETAETSLYEQAPTYLNNKIDYQAIQNINSNQYNQLLQQQFNNYVLNLQIQTPFANSAYDARNAFTWNYKYSICTQPPTNSIVLSGGDWRDVYQKTYGTPYPHLEPWILQGYTNKPSWWDEVFANDDPITYGVRRWKYKHGIPITTLGTNTFTVAGDQTAIFNNFDTFTVFSGSNQNTYSIDLVSLVLGNTIISTTIPIVAGTNIGDTIRIGMWDYILRGVIPVAQMPPINVTLPLQTWNYVSVNISEDTYSDGFLAYNPDDVFPPYFNYLESVPLAGQPINATVRSLFFNLSLEISSENVDFLWNDAGPIEWIWRNSTAYLYSLVSIAYIMQPVITIQSIFGVPFEYINNLPIDSASGQVYSHINTQFYGELPPNSNVPYIVNGINQWYVNYNRYSGIDSSFSDFRTMWTTWTTPLCYQFSGFVDTQSFQLYQRILTVTPSDWNITLKRSPGVENFWFDTFQVRLVSIPQNLNLYDTQNQWVLEIDSQSPTSHEINYFDVQLYDFSPISNTTFSLYTYPIAEIGIAESTFGIIGDVSTHFGGQGATQFQISNSFGNDGTYNIISSTYNYITNVTTIAVQEVISSSAIKGTVMALNYRTIPWSTGTLVSLETTEFLPDPLKNSLQYFIIVTSPTTFQLAYTPQDVTLNIPILLDSLAYGIQRVGLLHNTFTALSGNNSSNTWRHYEIDTTNTKTFIPSYNLTGMQNFVNLVDGYNSYLISVGFGVNVTGEYYDPQTGTQVNWQEEIERFIDWAYRQRIVQRQRLNDKYSIDINYITNQISYIDQNPNFSTGTPVVVWAYGGGLPSPLMRNVFYYIINTGTVISLATSAENAASSIAITLSNTPNVGTLYISAASIYSQQLPTFEINPIRNALWFTPSMGIVSNILTGPYQNIHNQQLVFDQYGQRVTTDNIRVFRQDKLTYIQYKNNAFNDNNVFQLQSPNPYNYLHLGGANLFIDTYEHLLIFNNYTTESALLYDPFLGVNTTKFELNFYKQTPFSERPNVGGYFLSSPNNQGAEQLRNIEGTINDLRYAYDTYEARETLPLVQNARALLGYQGVQDYLTDINLTPKSQFLFWKGAIHAKGSSNAITAFINSILFLDAGVDEFWAYQIATFGSNDEQDYLKLFLTTTDTQSNQLRLEFIRDDQICNPGYSVETFGDENCGYANPQDGTTITYNVDSTFIAIATSDETRWVNQPDVNDELNNIGGSLYFDLKTTTKIPIILSQVAPSDDTPGDAILVQTDSSVLYQFWVNTDTGWVLESHWHSSDTPIFRHNLKADNIQINYQLYPDGTSTDYIYGSMNTGSFVATNELDLLIPYIPLSNSIKVFINDVPAIPAVDYVESLELYPGSQILGYKLYFTNSIQVSETNIRVVYGIGQLSVGLQYNIINSNIFEMVTNELIADLFSKGGQMTIWGQIVDKESLNPENITDTEANVNLSPITYWDPARGYHFYNSLHAIDLQTNTDPANYDASTGWKDNQVNITWLDTTNVDYKPYYDPIVMPDVNIRFQNWGALTDYGVVHLYQWTKSDIPPTQWNAEAAIEQIDSSIDVSIRKSGTVKQNVVYRVRNSTGPLDLNGWPVDSQGNPRFITDTQIRVDFDPLTDALTAVTVDNVTTYTFQLLPPPFATNDVVNVYVNGTFNQTMTLSGSGPWPIVLPLNNYDHVVAINPVYVPTVIDLAFTYPTISDNSSINTQWALQTNSVIVPSFDVTTNSIINTYYFWVENKTTPTGDKEAIINAVEDLISIPQPYVFFSKFEPAETIELSPGQNFNLPNRFVQAIFVGLRGYVNEDMRFAIQFTRDFTLRDNLRFGSSPLQLKDTHQEWTMFRRNQLYNIPLPLWNKIIESLVGYTLLNSSVRVPSLNRQLYDQTYGTQTQYGLGTGQTFVNSSLALATILNYLNRPGNTFQGIDINTFFANNSFDTPANIITAMNNIYTTFSYIDVNAIFFEVLMDALSTQQQFVGLMKTSAVALYGIQLLDVSGAFDY